MLDRHSGTAETSASLHPLAGDPTALAPAVRFIELWNELQLPPPGK